MRRYTILLEYDSETDAYSVKVPAIPGCFTWGKTVEEAVDHAKEAIELCIEQMVADGEPVPEEPVPLKAMVVDVAA